MIPAFTTKFTTNTRKARITDIYNYSAIIRDAIYANITAKLGNTPFHQNTDYDTNADIVIGTNTFVDIDLPHTGLAIQNGLYTFIENVKIINEVLYRPLISSGYLSVTAPGSNNFTSILLTSPPGTFSDDIANLLATIDDVRVGFYNSSNVLLASAVITTYSEDSLGFNAVALSSFATIAKIRIIGSNIYSTTKTYSWIGCDVATASLQATSDCYRSQLTVIDCTQYPSNATLARTLTVQYPSLANGSHVLPTIETSDASLVLGPNIWTGAYTITLSSVLNWTQTEDGLLIETIITGAIYPNVQCNFALCALATCIGNFRTKLLAARANGSKDLAALVSDNLIIGLYLDGIRLAIDCENSDTATRLISELIIFMGEGSSTSGCNCGCSDQTNDVPTEIFPLFTTASTSGRLLPYNAGIAYPVDQLILFEGQEFIVLTATNAGENPNTNRGKFKFLGGGINIGNIAVNSGNSATLNKNSGIITFSALTGLNFAEQVIISINNTTITAGTDIECYLTNCADGQGAIVNKTISNNLITLYVENLNNAGDQLFEFNVWFNNRA